MGDNADHEEATRRRAERHSFFLLADVVTASGAVTGKLRVRNLSETGAMGDTGMVLEPGEAITVDLRGVGPVSAKVAWANGGRVGLAFDHRINPHLALKPVGGPRKPM